MQDLNDKVFGGTLTAAEWNEVPSEIQNVIEALGQTLSSGDLNQLGKSIAGYIANANFYTDTGIADAYVLTKIGSKQSATAYTDGFAASFIVGNTNTGASTVNIVGLGIKNIIGSEVAGSLVAGEYRDIRYRASSGDFTLTPFNSRSVSYTPAGSGAVVRAVENRLKDVLSVKDFGAVVDGSTDDYAALALAVAALSAGDTLVFPAGSYFVSGSQILEITVDDVTIIGWGAELQSENSDDPETATFTAFTPQLKFTGNNPRLLGLTWRGGLFTVNNIDRFFAFGGRSYNLHNVGFTVLADTTPCNFFHLHSWDFDTSLDTSVGNFAAAQCGAVATDPKNGLALIESCTFKGLGGGVNMHNFRDVRILQADSKGGANLHFKTDQGCNNIEVSGIFDGAAINGGSTNRHLSAPSNFCSFFSGVSGAGNFTERVRLDLTLRNFTSTAGIYYSDTFSATVTTGTIVGRDCSVPVFSRAGGFVDVDFDLVDCTGDSVILAYDAGTTVAAIDQTITGKFENSKIKVGNNSATTQADSKITLKQLKVDYSGTDGAIEAVDKGAAASATVGRVIVEDSQIKVGGGTGIIGIDSTFTMTIGNNTYEGATTDFTGQKENGYADDPFTGNIPVIQFGQLNVRNTAAGAINYGVTDANSEVGDVFRVINDGASVVNLLTLTLDGFSTTNQLAINATIEIQKTDNSTNKWRTIASYGTITQS